MEVVPQTVVCDNGSAYVKCGLAGDNLPRLVFPSVVGSTKVSGDHPPNLPSKSDAVIGEDAVASRHTLEVQHPMRHGVVQDWDAMVSLWDYTFYEQLRLQPECSHILLTEPTFNPAKNRHQTLEVMFEHYGFEGALVHLQAALSLYSRGLLTGLALDIGDGVSHTVPMWDGLPWMHACKRINLGGAQVTSYLMELLLRRGHLMRQGADLVDVERMKHKLCYVSCDYQQDAKLARETTALVKPYTLPDGSVVRVGQERFQAPELLFNPSLCGIECKGVADILFQTVQAMDMDARMSMYENIVVSGGCTALPGLPTRLDQELCGLYETHVLRGKEATKKVPVKLLHISNRKHLVFTGGAMLADIMRDSPRFWISRQEWAEDPHRAINSKCPGAISTQPKK